MGEYGIMRVEKYSRGAVAGLQAEANRTEADHTIKGRDFDDSDIDWSKTDSNIRLAHTDNWRSEINRQIQAAGINNVRKDAIVMLGGMYTASDTWFANHTYDEMIQYFRDCLQYHIDTYCGGDRSLLINAVIHIDEQTPHMQVASIPIIRDDKGAHLSAKIIMGGRADYRKRQDKFFAEVTKKRGMDRGEVQMDPAERKLHTTKREWQIATQDERLAKVTAELQTAQQRADQAQQKADRAAEEIQKLKASYRVQSEALAKILNKKARASEIHHIFGDHETQSYHVNMLESTRAIGAEVREELQQMQDDIDSLAVRERAVAQREAAVDPLYAQAAKAKKEAQQLRDRQAEYIQAQAQQIAQAQLAAVFAEATDSYTRRLQDYCEHVTNSDGRTVLEAFAEREQAEHDRLRQQINHGYDR